MGGKRILILVENLPVPFDRRVWMEATTLVQAGYAVTVICPQGRYPRRFEVLDGVHVYRYPLPSLDGLAGHLWEYSLSLAMTFVLTWVVFWREGFDVIQSANPPDFFFLIGGLFKLLGRKFVFDHHDLVPETCETRWSGWKLALIKGLCLAAERATFRTADRVIATNHSYRQIAIRRGRVAPERVVVVRSGPRLDAFRPQPPAPELRAGRDYLVGYLGVMGPNDGLGHLLQAIDHIVNQLGRGDIRFVLIGAGDLLPQLREQAERLGLSEHVVFTGRIPDAEVLAWLSSVDVGVAPDPKDALNDVSTMNKIVEYMALGRPVVAFDLAEARVSAGEAAAYARANDPADFAGQILALLADPERRAAMGASGRRRFETELAWDHQQKHLLGLYQGLWPDRPAKGGA